jgi:hypothetical protein
MVEDAPLLRYDAEQRMAANEGGFTLLAEMREMRARIMALESQSQKLESHRQKHMDIRRRAISTWPNV